MALKDVCKEEENIIFTALAKPYVNKSQDCQMKLSVKTINELFLASSTRDEFLNFILGIDKDQIAEIERVTRGQSNNPLWLAFRQHVITASKAHSVKTRIETAESKGFADTNFDAVTKCVAEKSELHKNIPAIKYGNSMEAEAVQKFYHEYLTHHQDVQIR